MSQTRVWASSASDVTRTDDKGGSKAGCSLSTRLYVGRSLPYNPSFQFYSYLKFAADWDGVGVLTKAVLTLPTDDRVGPQLGPGASPKIIVRRLLTQFWLNGHNADEHYDNADWTLPQFTLAGQVIADMKPDANAVNEIDITDIIRALAPATVQGGGKATDCGLGLYGGASTAYPERWSGWSFSKSDETLRPFITLTFEPGPSTPNVPTPLAPAGSVNASDVVFSGIFTDDKEGNYLTRTEVQVYSPGAAPFVLDPMWATNHVASNSERATSQFSVIPVGLNLQRGVAYRWFARCYNQEGLVSDWAGPTVFTVSNFNPYPPVPAPVDGVFDSLVGVLFRGGEFSDPDAGDPSADPPVSADTLGAYQVQMAVMQGEGDPENSFEDPYPIVWDSGKKYTPSGATNFETKYGGMSCAANIYYVRMRVWDNHGGRSDWAYTMLTLNFDFVAAPGQQASAQINSQAPWRIRILAMGVNRGPGALLAVFENAKSVGASLIYNSAGEAHFTLPIDDPQVSVVEPKQVHYAIDFYSEDGWRETFAGLVWDYDADQNSVVFTCLDYLALTNLVFDERFDPNDVEKDCLHGGSYHNQQTIRDIVIEQLVYAVGAPNSLVGFITVGNDFDAMSEVVTIPGTYVPSLQFIVGLLDSHRQGTGKLTRLEVRRNANGTYQYAVKDNPGTIRENLRLKYGELVNGYRVIPFGINWASVIHMIGQTREGVNLLYETASAPGIDQSVWGNIARAMVVDNLQDKNDIKRRVKEAALQYGKLGQNMGLALRSGILGPRNGWDVCDVFPVEIIHGVVDTTRFGSGYWACLGFTWEAGDSGEQNLVMTLKPREDETAPDPDLIPSHPLSPQAEWQIGWVAPTNAVVIAAGITSQYYFDPATGTTYERDPNASGDDPIYVPVTTDPFNRGHVHVWNEVPAGTIGSGNAVFTLAAAPVPVNSLLLYRNGLLLKAGAGNDFQLAGLTITFEAGNVPDAGAGLVASYTIAGA